MSEFFAGLACVLSVIALSCAFICIKVVKGATERGGERAILAESLEEVEERFGSVLGADPELKSISYSGDRAYVYYTLTPAHLAGRKIDPAFQVKVTLSRGAFHVTSIEPF